MMGKDGIKFTNRYKLRIRLQSAWLQEVGILEESLREGHLKTESICCFHQKNYRANRGKKRPGRRHIPIQAAL
jgi:hypothetical protein